MHEGPLIDARPPPCFDVGDRGEEIASDDDDSGTNENAESKDEQQQCRYGQILLGMDQSRVDAKDRGPRKRTTPVRGALAFERAAALQHTRHGSSMWFPKRFLALDSQ